VLPAVLSSNIADYALEKRQHEMPVNTKVNRLCIFPINTNQLPCKWIDVCT